MKFHRICQIFKWNFIRFEKFSVDNDDAVHDDDDDGIPGEEEGAEQAARNKLQISQGSRGQTSAGENILRILIRTVTLLKTLWCQIWISRCFNNFV